MMREACLKAQPQHAGGNFVMNVTTEYTVQTLADAKRLRAAQDVARQAKPFLAQVEDEAAKILKLRGKDGVDLSTDRNTGSMLCGAQLRSSLVFISHPLAVMQKISSSPCMIFGRSVEGSGCGRLQATSRTKNSLRSRTATARQRDAMATHRREGAQAGKNRR